MNAARDNSQVPKVRWKLVTSILLASTVVTSAVLYQQRVEVEWSQLPEVDRSNVDSMQARLGAVEGFMERYPVWLGSQRAQRERTRLSTELQVLRTERVLAGLREQEQRELALGEATSSRRLGVQMAESGDYPAAIVHFEHALMAAPSDWAEAEQVERDIEAIRDWLEGGDE